MSVDGDSTTDGMDSECPREMMRSEVNLIFNDIKQFSPLHLYPSNPGIYCHLVALPGIIFSIFSTSIGACFSTYIPLMRLVQTVHHTKKRSGNILREGWLLHHTNIDSLVSHTQLISGNI